MTLEKAEFPKKTREAVTSMWELWAGLDWPCASHRPTSRKTVGLAWGFFTWALEAWVEACD